MKPKDKHTYDKDGGVEPRNIPRVVEDGNDDCGEDLTGLGRGAYYTDAPLDTDSDEDAGTFITLPAGLRGATCGYT
eukprot:9477332-Pyramimonas_sp.AAC.1